MKKNTLTAIVNYLTNNLSYADENEKEFLQATIDELNAELAKGKAKADANRQAYAEMHDVVVKALADANNPVTAQEIADETGLSRGKIVWGLNNLWTDEVVKDNSGKTVTYSLA